VSRSLDGERQSHRLLIRRERCREKGRAPPQFESGSWLAGGRQVGTLVLHAICGLSCRYTFLGPLTRRFTAGLLNNRSESFPATHRALPSRADHRCATILGRAAVWLLVAFHFDSSSPEKRAALIIGGVCPDDIRSEGILEQIVPSERSPKKKTASPSSSWTGWAFLRGARRIRDSSC